MGRVIPNPSWFDLLSGSQKFLFIFGIIYVVAVWIANIVLCYRLAQSKNRDNIWLFLALFFGFLITLILAGLTTREITNEYAETKPLKCAQCDFESVNSGSMDNHVKYAHPKQT